MREIVGFIRNRYEAWILINGLAQLEYGGYDSIVIVVYNKKIWQRLLRQNFLDKFDGENG